MRKKQRRFKNLITSIVFLVMIFSLATISSERVYGISAKLKFEHIKSANGLSHDTVYCISQDKDGFMWFGTEDGLNKYDGIKMQTSFIQLKNMVL